MTDTPVEALEPKALERAYQAMSESLGSDEFTSSIWSAAQNGLSAYLVAPGVAGELWLEFNDLDGFTGLRRWTRDAEQAERWKAEPNAGRFETYAPASADRDAYVQGCKDLGAQVRHNTARAEAAEADRDRLREALWAIAAQIPKGGSDPLFNTPAEKLVFAALKGDAPSEPTCRLCGCTENNACWDEERDACSWKEPDLCSHCADSASLLEELLTGTTPDGTPSDRIEALYDGAEVGEISLPVHHAQQLLKIAGRHRDEQSP